MRQRLLVWLGMAGAMGLVGVAAALAWTALLNHEATQYGQLLSERIRQTVLRIDQATQTTFDAHNYHRLHGQPLLRMDLEKDPVLQSYVRSLGDILQNPHGGGALYTECPVAEKMQCYTDFLFGIPNIRHLKDYNPKSRPWYLLAHGHQDWVVFPFFLTKFTVPGFPKLPSIGFVKRVVRGETGPESGIWVVLHTANPSQAIPGYDSTPLLKMLGNPPLTHLELFLGSMWVFPDSLLYQEGDSPFQCTSITEGMGLQYEASVHCTLRGEGIQFSFGKSYDHPGYFWLLVVGALGILYGAYWALRYVTRLQDLTFQGQLSARIETKLVHDLKKGILTQLNKFFDPQPDLKHHRDSLTLLNKYVTLLGNSIRRKKEENWIPLTLSNCRHYLTWILGEVPIRETEGTSGGAFVEIHYDTDVEIRWGTTWPELSVPEMGFYRILKNIIENYNTHGFGGLHIAMKVEGEGLLLTAKNALAKSPAKGTQLGLVIIQQLLEDNFPKAYVRQNKEPEAYELIIFLG